MIPLKNLLVAFLVCSSIVTFAQFRYYEKGHDFYKSGKYNDAITNLTSYLTKSTRDKSIDIDVFYLRGLSHYKLNHFQEAIPDFEETLLRGHLNRGNIYWFMAKCYDNLKNGEEAINSYSNAIRELRDNPETKSKLLNERSQVYARMGNQKMADADLTEAKGGKVDRSTIQNTTPQNESASSSRTAETPGKQQTTTKTVAEKAAVAAVPLTQVPKEEVSPLAEMYKDEKRFALVIGNSGYPKQIGTLKNPVNDATDIAKELTASNFDVTLLTNATYGQIRAALMKFKEKLDGGVPEQTVGLFYYAGHGLQFEDENYLVPVDASVEFADDIPRYCFPINRMVLANMERSNTRMNIVILDACRNNPFPSLNRSLDNSGLGEMKRARGSFIAYATEPGSVASDGTGRNGLYTQELLKAMSKKGLRIEQVFKEVRANVLRLSNNKQNTWDSSNIIGEFHFRY